MNKMAVVEVGGHQYFVQAGTVIETDKISGNQGETIKLDKVLLLCNEKEVKIGKPYLKDSFVAGKIIEHKKGKKIRIARFKSKSRYRRVKGYRADLSIISIEGIENGKN